MPAEDNSAVMGIDVGLSGGIAVISKSGMVVTQPMPAIPSGKGGGKLLSLNMLLVALAAWSGNIRMCFVEFVSARPGQSAPSTFKFGRVFGSTEALLVAVNIPYTLVTSRQWTQEMHQGTSGDDPKKKSLSAVARLFPRTDLRRTEKCTTMDSGMVDALLIAEYGRRKIWGVK